MVLWKRALGVAYKVLGDSTHIPATGPLFPAFTSQHMSSSIMYTFLMGTL
jgi:hypothetical protein